MKKPNIDPTILATVLCVCVLVGYQLIRNRLFESVPVAVPQTIKVSSNDTKPYINEPKKSSKISNDILDKMMRDIVFQGKPFIVSYRIDDGFCNLNINPALWNSLSRGEQKQIGDLLAASTAWDGRILSARIYVLKTEVGKIRPNISGGYEFLLTPIY